LSEQAKGTDSADFATAAAAACWTGKSGRAVRAQRVCV